MIMKKAQILILVVLTAMFWTACTQSETSNSEATPAESTATEVVEEAPANVWDSEFTNATIAEEAFEAAAAEGAMVFAVNTDESSVAWRGKKLAYAHNGTIAINDAELHVLGEELAGAKIVLDMASIVNEDVADEKKNADLVGHLKSSDFFDAEQFPTATFELTSVTPAEEGAAATHNLSGNLTIKGITKGITVPATVSMGETGISAKSMFTIDRTAWDVKYSSGTVFTDLVADKVIADEIDFVIDLVATPAVTEEASY